MAHPPFLDYRRRLKRSAQKLRRKLWFEYCGICAAQMLVIELDGDSHFTPEAEAYERRRTDAL